MLYTVPQVASLLNISKQSVYTKLKQPMYCDKIISSHNQTMIDDTLLKLIQDNLRFTASSNTDLLGDQSNAEEMAVDDESININQELLSLLRDQLKEKDDQLKAKDLQFTNQLIAKDIQIDDYSERLKQAHKLIENNQVLLKERPKQDILMLEEHFNNLDGKLEEVKNNMNQRKEQQKKKSIFSKIFKSKE